MTIGSAIGLLAQLDIGTSYGGLFGLLLLILQIVVIVSILAGSGTPGHKLLWTLVVLLLPVIGLILYFVIGRSGADRPLPS